MDNLAQQRDWINSWMAKNNAVFVLNKNGKSVVQENSYDPIPRVISADDFNYIERGLMQRVNALNLFLNDIYGNRMIVRDGVIPEQFVFSSPEFRSAYLGYKPPKSLFNHISATDLIQCADGNWYVMEDNLGVPLGAAYPLFSRKLAKSIEPESFENDKLCDNSGFAILLNQLYTDVAQGLDNKGGITVILSQGENSPSYFELNYMAEITNSILAMPEELTIMDDSVYYRSPQGGFQKVSVIHRQTPDNDLDPLIFDIRSGTGVSHLMEACRSGKVAVISAPGCALADDKGLYYFIPDMIRYYLDEEPILPNVPTYLPTKEDELSYILGHLPELVIRDVTGKGDKKTYFGSGLSGGQIQELRNKLIRNPRRYVAQKVMDIAKLDTLSEDGKSIEQCRCYFRAFTVHCDSIRVWMGGISRFTRNGSGKSGFKDTWILSE